ncbi:hypothetical protein Nepgr_004868 [Nepenthes gracilis]|uniref:Uncharacterized protein n=1 Tax=Nepenthes gracilis TaxID=150966 RepID=A0AAD3XFM6_NEPGR|nr:hypothetical protein Nepgr_004868 [Nepenthes gracilis]
MLEADASWLCQRHSVKKTPDFSCMISPFEPKQHELLHADINPCRFSADVGPNGYGISALPERSPILETRGLIRQCSPHLQTPLLTTNPFVNEKQSLLSTRLDGKPSTCEAFSPQRKGYLIFDQSGNETRLILNSLCSPVQNSIAAIQKSFCGYECHVEGHVVNVEKACFEMPILGEELHENHEVAEGSDSHEDTEEINALLYSSDEDNDGGDDSYNGEEDDELSTGHSPERLEDDTEEVASSDGSSKRFKTLNDGYCQSPLKDTARVVRPHGLYEDEYGVGFSCSPAVGMGPVVGGKRSRKDKIVATLRILQSIIPGVKGKDPFRVLDEAIDYLKCLKHEAKALSLEDCSKCHM